jgi:hypothetical protein
MVDFSQGFGKIWQRCTVGPGMCVAGPEALNQSDSLFSVRDGKKGVVEFTPVGLGQLKFEPSRHSASDSFLVGNWYPWLLGVNRLVCLHSDVMPGLLSRAWLGCISLYGIVKAKQDFYVSVSERGQK